MRIYHACASQNYTWYVAGTQNTEHTRYTKYLVYYLHKIQSILHVATQNNYRVC